MYLQLSLYISEHALPCHFHCYMIIQLCMYIMSWSLIYNCTILWTHSPGASHQAMTMLYPACHLNQCFSTAVLALYSESSVQRYLSPLKLNQMCLSCTIRSFLWFHRTRNERHYAEEHFSVPSRESDKITNCMWLLCGTLFVLPE